MLYIFLQSAFVFLRNDNTSIVFKRFFLKKMKFLYDFNVFLRY